jgi:xanthine dehydrogenase accessory factor
VTGAGVLPATGAPVLAPAGAPVLVRAAALACAGQPFALATVTWRRGPSSGKGGSKAIVHPDGVVEGWLGGACAEPTVVAEALRAIADGSPRLLVLGEPDARPGVTVVPMSCSSEGAMEVFVEPVLPVPELWVVGRSPAVATLCALAEVLGWAVHAAERDLDPAAIGAGAMVVVATQGHADEPALAAALASAAGYIGLVASGRRADGVRAALREQGVDEERLAAVRAPAGLDLGATAHHEIAVAVLAELVALRAAGRLSAQVTVAAPELALDPVCGMSVDVAGARFTVAHEGATVYFCANGCRRAFQADPAAFPLAGSGQPRPSGARHG